MMVMECMEDDSMHRKVGTLQVSQLRGEYWKCGAKHKQPKKGQKIKWDKNPTKDRRVPAKKKPWDIAKVCCFNCKELGHFVEDYKKVGHNLVQGGFTTKANVVK
jgi:hypothetical protein